MSKVPVGKSIAHAYEFLFGRFFQVIGTAWLPALLYAVGYFFWLENSATWLAPLTQDQGLLINGVLATAGFVVLALVVRAVLGISLTQEALGIRKDLALAHFVIGPRELRLFFAQIRLLLLVIVLEIAVVAVVVLGLGAAAKYGSAIAGLPLVAGKPLVVVAAMFVALVIYVAFVLAVLKLSFFLAAVAAVEHRASVRRGWRLAAGSGWRILFVLVGILAPLIAGLCALLYFLVGADLASALQAAGADPAARGHAALQFYAGHAMLISAIVGVVSIVGGALLAGATATAYRTVTGHELEEPEDDAALVAPLIAPVESHDDHGHGGGHDTGHGGHDDHGHGGHDDHGDKGHGHDDHGHGGHDDHGDKGHGHDDHGHGGHDDKGHGHDDHGHDDHGDKGHGHDDHGHGGHDDHGHGHDDHGHGEKAHGDDDHGGGHGDSHGNGHDDHGHGGHDDDGHGDKSHGHDDHGHGDHGHGGHGDGHHHHARAA
ncbi:MAG: hypothetical protein WDM81_08705 [Rhizomicrobium sp.]